MLRKIGYLFFFASLIIALVLVCKFDKPSACVGCCEIDQKTGKTVFPNGTGKLSQEEIVDLAGCPASERCDRCRQNIKKGKVLNSFYKNENDCRHKSKLKEIIENEKCDCSIVDKVNPNCFDCQHDQSCESCKCICQYYQRFESCSDK